MARFDLDSVGGRVAATRALAPIVADIRDSLSREELIREVSRHLGVDVGDFSQAVRRAPRGGIAEAAKRTRDKPVDTAPEPDVPVPAYEPPNLRDPIVRAEHMLLQCVVQFPSAVPTQQLDPVDPGDLTAPAHRAVFEAVRSVGIDPTRSQGAWVSAINESVPEVVRPLVAQLAVEALPTKLDSQGRPDWHYVRSLVVRVREVALRRKISQVMSALRRSDDPEQSRAISAQLTTLQRSLNDLLANLE
ncbi:hypothetical protein [Flexivirga alba]|uniref:DNA helicase DnaB-like N-terminal domain-containing protein n=1 Tax=Flexivirga alba TaxID=702742 RepID=A0ABW2ALC4_9MICO